MNDAVIIAGKSNEPLAQAIASKLNLQLCPLHLSTFPSGEIHLELLVSVRNRNIYIIQSGYTYDPAGLSPNDYLMQCVMIVDACFRAAARKITLVLPCIAYTEEPLDDVNTIAASIECKNDLQQWLKDTMFPQSTTASSRPQSALYQQLQEHHATTIKEDPITITADISTHPNPFKLVASLLTCSGASHILTFALPRPQLVGYFDVPVDNLPPAPLLSTFFNSSSSRSEKQFVIVVPDLSLAKQAGQIAHAMNLPFAFLQKLDEVFQHAGADVLGQNVLLMDDTASDLAFQAASVLKSAFHASSVSLLMLHLTLPNPPRDILKLQSPSSPFDQIFVTNSVQIPHGLVNKVQVIDLAGYLADAIKCLHHGKSLRSLNQ